MSNEIKPVATATWEDGRLCHILDCSPLENGRHRLYDQSAIDRLKAERDGWIEQHHRDSVQLRAICSERDVAWLQCKELAARLAEYKADADDAAIERAAIALHRNGADSMTSETPWQHLHDGELRQFRSWARTAIDAARKGVE